MKPESMRLIALANGLELFSGRGNLFADTLSAEFFWKAADALKEFAALIETHEETLAPEGIDEDGPYVTCPVCLCTAAGEAAQDLRDRVSSMRIHRAPETENPVHMHICVDNKYHMGTKERCSACDWPAKFRKMAEGADPGYALAMQDAAKMLEMAAVRIA